MGVVILDGMTGEGLTKKVRLESMSGKGWGVGVGCVGWGWGTGDKTGEIKGCHGTGGGRLLHKVKTLAFTLTEMS